MDLQNKFVNRHASSHFSLMELLQKTFFIKGRLFASHEKGEL
jgi:hypothetical protein